MAPPSRLVWLGFLADEGAAATAVASTAATEDAQFLLSDSGGSSSSSGSGSGAQDAHRRRLAARSKVGGVPRWLLRQRPTTAGSASTVPPCGLCGGARSFVLQLNAPLDATSDRVLYLFACLGRPSGGDNHSAATPAAAAAAGGGGGGAGAGAGTAATTQVRCSSRTEGWYVVFQQQALPGADNDSASASASAATTVATSAAAAAAAAADDDWGAGEADDADDWGAGTVAAAAPVPAVSAPAAAAVVATDDLGGDDWGAGDDDDGVGSSGASSLQSLLKQRDSALEGAAQAQKTAAAAAAAAAGSDAEEGAVPPLPAAEATPEAVAARLRAAAVGAGLGRLLRPRGLEFEDEVSAAARTKADLSHERELLERYEASMAASGQAPLPTSAAEVDGGGGGKKKDATLAAAVAGWEGEEYEDSSEEDRAFRRFRSAMSRAPQQVVRYYESEDAEPLVLTSFVAGITPAIATGGRVAAAADRQTVPACPSCGAQRIAEAQVLATLIAGDRSSLMMLDGDGADQDQGDDDDDDDDDDHDVEGGEGAAAAVAAVAPPLEFGIVTIFSCPASCCAPGQVGAGTEFVHVQAAV